MMLMTILLMLTNNDFYRREAMFYERLKDNKVRCNICFRHCIIYEGKRGFCRNRENRKGKLYNIVHSKPSAVQIDPIEKEPLYHFLPGTNILCIGTAGCNFRCSFCHNWHLSQRSLEEMYQYYEYSPEDIIKLARKYKCPTISFTYNEPIAFYEYVYDIAKLAKKEGIRVIFHTNGSFNPEPLRELLKYVDAVTVDWKGFSKRFYQELLKADVEPVTKSLKVIKEEGKHLEIVNLIIPGYNDAEEDIRDMCLWIRDSLTPDVPLHFSRFFPNYKLTNISPTPVKTLEKAHQIAKEVGLHYVTIGNCPGHKYNSTFCPKCGKRLIHRRHFAVLENLIKEGKCPKCSFKISGVWQ